MRIKQKLAGWASELVRREGGGDGLNALHLHYA
jgi:hypothetical protein